MGVAKKTSGKKTTAKRKKEACMPECALEKKTPRKKKAVVSPMPVVSKVVVKYDVGFNNQLYIRGSAPGLSWDKGVMMKNIGPDEWVWEVAEPFSSCEFKVLINDHWYEGGGNHQISRGSSIQYTPSFY